MSRFSVANQARMTRLFKRYGSDGTGTELQITKTTGRVIDQVNQTRTPGIPVTTNLIGMISRFENETFEGTRVQRNDILVNVDSAIEPEKEDIIVVDSENHTIMGIRPVRTDNIIMAYLVHVRK